MGRGQPHRDEHRQAAGDASKGLNCGSARPKLGPHIGLDPNQLLLLRRGELIASNRERERTGGDFAAAPSVAEHGCLVGVELTALCRALGGRWRGFGALTHGRPTAVPLARLWRGGLPHKRHRHWRTQGPRRAAGSVREAKRQATPPGGGR